MCGSQATFCHHTEQSPAHYVFAKPSMLLARDHEDALWYHYYQLQSLPQMNCLCSVYYYNINCCACAQQWEATHRLLCLSHSLEKDEDEVSDLSASVYKSCHEVVRTTIDDCTCKFCHTTRMPCKHIFGHWQDHQLAICDESLCDRRWLMACYKDHRVRPVGKRVQVMPSCVFHDVIGTLFKFSPHGVVYAAAMVSNARLQSSESLCSVLPWN